MFFIFFFYFYYKTAEEAALHQFLTSDLNNRKILINRYASFSPLGKYLFFSKQSSSDQKHFTYFPILTSKKTSGPEYIDVSQDWGWEKGTGEYEGK